MEAPIRDKVIGLLQRFFVGDPASLLAKSDNDLINSGVTLIQQVLVGHNKRKRMRFYMMQLLDIPAIAERLKEWRNPAEPGFEYHLHAGCNILHFACESYNKDFIMKVIEKCGEELSNIPNDHDMVPAYCLQFNHQHQSGIFSLLEFFHERDVDLTQLKETIVSLYDINSAKNCDTVAQANYGAHRKTLREIIRFFSEHQMLTDDDAKRMEKTLEKLLANRYWRSSKGASKFPSLNKEFFLFYRATMKAHPEEKDQTLHKVVTQHSIWKFFLAQHPDLVDFWIRHKFLTAYIATLMSHTLSELITYRSTKQMDFLEKYLDLVPHDDRILKQLSSRDSEGGFWNYLVSQMKFHTRNIPRAYIEALKPRLEAWVHGPVFSKPEQDNIIFDIEKLPSELIAQVVGFAPYKTVRAFALTCKKFRELVDKHILIWHTLMQRYFPLDVEIPLQQSNETSFKTRYYNKFKMNEGFQLPFGAPYGFSGLEVTKSVLIWTSREDFGLYDMESQVYLTGKQAAEYTKVNCAARLFNDTIIVRSNANTIETYAKNDLRLIGSHEIPEMTAHSFAVSDQFMFNGNVIIDWQRGQVVSKQLFFMRQCVVRQGLCYGVSAGQLCVLDPRTKSAVIQRDVDFSLDNLALNVYEHNIYITHSNIEIFDTRMMNQSRKSALCLGRQRTIDLVSMNVWENDGVWDLTDLQWSYCTTHPAEFQTTLAVCNGEHVIHSQGYSLYARPLSGEQYFPYGDFRIIQNNKSWL